MTTIEDINRETFESYEEEVEKLQEVILPQLPVAGEGSFDGREWCDEHDIPESAFSDAINWSSEADYGVTPMQPWSAKY